MRWQTKNRYFVLSLMLTVALLAGGYCKADAISERAMEILKREIAKPFPKAQCQNAVDPADNCVWGKLLKSLAQFYIGVNDADSNAELAQAVSRATKVLELEKGLKPSRGFGSEARNDSFHFAGAAVLFRAVALFGGSGKYRAHAIDPKTEDAVVELYWAWAIRMCRLEDTSTGKLWDVWASENHAVQRDVGCWQAAKLFHSTPSHAQKQYPDRSTPGQQYAAWSAYLSRFVVARATSGLFIESFSPSYAPYTLASLYNVADFSEDPTLKRLATNIIDLWWAIWAQEQVDGNHGGAKTRVYVKEWNSSPAEKVAWMYFELLSSTGIQSPFSTFIATSFYRPPNVVDHIARSWRSRGNFETQTKVTAYLRRPISENWYYIDPSRYVLRYSYTTADFVMGTFLFSPNRKDLWADMSSQNRWNGVVLKGPDRERIFALPAAAAGNTAYNAVWGTQIKGTQLVQKIPPPFSQNAGPMKIWYSKGLKPTIKKGWLFLQSGAYVAARPAFGGFNWEDDSNAARILDEHSPVIIHAAPLGDFTNLAQFEDAILSLPITVRDSTSVATLSLNGQSILFPLAYGERISVNGKPVRSEQDDTYRGKFVNSYGNKVIISDGIDQLTLQFPD